MTTLERPRTVGELKASGYQVLPVREEMRKNLIAKIRSGEDIFPGIFGYEETVAPHIVNAILAGQDIIFLGERGQAKSRIIRSLTSLLDDATPALAGCEIPENPLDPITKAGRDIIEAEGDSAQLVWLERDLARLPANTPVVTFNHIPFYSTSEVIDGYREGGTAPTVIDIGGTKQFRHTVSNAAEVLAALAKRRHVLALGGHVHIRELIDFGREGEHTRFENAAAIVGPSPTKIGVFPSGFTVYTVFNGVIDAGRFVRIDP